MEKKPAYPVPSDFARQAHLDTEQYQALYQRSIEQPEQFWTEQARALISWFEPWQSISTGSFAQQDMRWFCGAKLNAAYNCYSEFAKKSVPSPPRKLFNKAVF